MRSLFDIRDQVVAVAGAAGAFGSTVASELAARGCRLSLFDINAAGLENKIRDLPSASPVHSRVFDATAERDCESAFEAVIARWGRIDAFVNCVGAFEVTPAVDMPREVFSHVIETNLNAAFSMSRIAARHMMASQYGRIVNLASVSDSVANPGYSAYAASKSALTHMTRVMAVEWARHSITVNTVSPAMCETGLTASFLAKENNRELAKSRIPLNRLLEPEDILGAVILLISPAGSFITGQAIHVDGGRSIS